MFKLVNTNTYNEKHHSTRQIVLADSLQKCKLLTDLYIPLNGLY